VRGRAEAVTNVPEPTAGEAFRARYAEQYEPDNVGEDVLVNRIAALLDQIQRMEVQLEADGFTVLGGNQQVASHPLLATVRAHSSEVARLLGRLDLKPEAIASTRARVAADARWQKA
jgi:hypothetical protein